MSVIREIEQGFKKKHVVDVRSGDTIRVHQKIREGNKERVQVFEGLVIRTDRTNSHTARITVRRIASGIGVEKTYLLHSPLVVKVEVTKRSKVRRNYLSYMRSRTGKAARLSSVDFDKSAVNAIPDVENDVETKPVKLQETEEENDSNEPKQDNSADKPDEKNKADSAKSEENPNEDATENQKVAKDEIDSTKEAKKASSK